MQILVSPFTSRSLRPPVDARQRQHRAAPASFLRFAIKGGAAPRLREAGEDGGKKTGAKLGFGGGKHSEACAGCFEFPESTVHIAVLSYTCVPVQRGPSLLKTFGAPCWGEPSGVSGVGLSTAVVHVLLCIERLAFFLSPQPRTEREVTMDSAGSGERRVTLGRERGKQEEREAGK